jgi:hypothetical protein
MLVIDSITAQMTDDYYYFPVEQTFEFPSTAGDFVSTGVTANDEFISELDGDPVVRTYNNFTINEGHLVRPTNRCKGLYLNILGDCIINGTLSMSARGAHAVGKYVGIDYRQPTIYFNETNIFIDKMPFILKDGGGAGTSAGANGQIAQNGISCGGGGAGANATGGSSAGSAGTSFSGGSGGGSRNRTSSTYGTSYSVAQANGGRGGLYFNGYGLTQTREGGGAGNPGGGAGYGPGSVGQSGTGGLLILIVHGNLTLGSAGRIVSDGANGGAGEGSRSGGGSSGGGCIDIYHKGVIENNGTIRANGGVRVTGGGAGGAGSIRITKF